MRWLAFLLLLPTIAFAQQTVSVSVPVRGNATVVVTLAEAPNAKATVVLFPGGNGVIAQVRRNFLLRIAPDILAQGFSVAAVDAASDQSGVMGWAYRRSPEHAAEISAVVAMLKARSAAKIWLMGTSNGTISAETGALALGRGGIAGVVLTSSVFPRLDFQKAPTIDVPVLLVHNKNDTCVASPPGSLEPFKAQLTKAPTVEAIWFTSSERQSDECGAMAPHGYLGIEKEVTARILDWIRAH